MAKRKLTISLIFGIIAIILLTYAYLSYKRIIEQDDLKMAMTGILGIGAAVIAISFVSFRIAFSISEAFIKPSLSALITDWLTPLVSNAFKGLRTELCSMVVVIT